MIRKTIPCKIAAKLGDGGQVWVTTGPSPDATNRLGEPDEVTLSSINVPPVR